MSSDFNRCNPVYHSNLAGGGGESRQMFKVIQRFGKQYSCHLHGKYVLVLRFLNPYIEHAVPDEHDVTNVIGETNSHSSAS